MSTATGAERPLLMIEGLCKRYPTRPTPLLDGVSLRLDAGQFLAVMGESGTGKSTLLNLIAGLDRPDAGRILLAGRDLATLDDDALTLLRRARIGFIFQAFHVLPYLTALQNVLLPLDLLGVPRGERLARAHAALIDCGVGECAPRYPRELSGGQLQRVAIARALVHEPSLVLADEPTGNLDAAAARQVLNLLRERLRAGGAAALLITHSLTAARAADRIMRLESGRLSALSA